MTETRKTGIFAVLFFLYFILVSYGAPCLPLPARLSDGAYLLGAQLICYLPPLCLYFAVTKKDIRQTLRLNALGGKNILLLIGFGLLIQPIINLLSYATSLLFPNPVTQAAEGIADSGFLLSMLAVAVFPAVFEELLARGVLLSGCRFLGKGRAAFFVALFFALLHLNPQQFPYAFVVGLLFSFLVERTDSLFASVLPHMIINGTTICSIFASSGTTEATTAGSPVIILLSLLFLAVLSLPCLAGLLHLFCKINLPKADLVLTDENGMPYRERLFYPETLVVLVLYLYFGLLPYFSFS